MYFNLFLYVYIYSIQFHLIYIYEQGFSRIWRKGLDFPQVFCYFYRYRITLGLFQTYDHLEHELGHEQAEEFLRGHYDLTYQQCIWKPSVVNSIPIF